MVTTSSSTTSPSNNLNNNNNNSTLPMGLEMISPITPPSGAPFPLSLPHTTHPADRGRREEGVGVEEEESGWSSGEFSNEEDNGQDSTSPGFEVGHVFFGVVLRIVVC